MKIKKFYLAISLVVLLISIINIINNGERNNVSLSLMDIVHMAKASGEHSATYTCYDPNSYNDVSGDHYNRVCYSSNCGKHYFDGFASSGSCTVWYD